MSMSVDPWDLRHLFVRFWISSFSWENQNFKWENSEIVWTLRIPCVTSASPLFYRWNPTVRIMWPFDYRGRCSDFYPALNRVVSLLFSAHFHHLLLRFLSRVIISKNIFKCTFSSKEHHLSPTPLLDVISLLQRCDIYTKYQEWSLWATLRMSYPILRS